MKPLYFRTPWPLTQRRLARVASIEVGEKDMTDRRIKRRVIKLLLKEQTHGSRARASVS